ncbi:FMN-dependent NADH-azoreductase [Glaciimonas sp. PCH181]|uniref:FMN-dependent NADH-azoreductase n=1 Tax=Glaciimonas sp. PCH181 TaxID=2133943 RepID=UPI000D36CD80|nr:FMN-dependent NADH-azoreductase [Glaciimonas sp. PCH181]PUA18978.1 FMN-dependent NADH-azoreductase [Glaciimonas sp. PCH181]
MTKLLHLNSSVRNTGSISRQLTAEFLTKWMLANPNDTIVERDLSANPVPHLTEQMMGAFFTPEAQRSPQQAETVKLSDSLINELMDADVIVIGAPMYNFSISSTLKAWIDHVARAGRTFKYTENGPVGLVQGKKVVIFTSRGGVYSHGAGKAMDFHETYLRAVLGFIGLSDIDFIHTEGMAMGEEAVASAISHSRSTMTELIPA